MSKRNRRKIKRTKRRNEERENGTEQSNRVYRKNVHHFGLFDGENAAYMRGSA